LLFVLVLIVDILNKSSEHRELALRNKLLRDSVVVKLLFKLLLLIGFESLNYYLGANVESNDYLSMWGELWFENKWSFIWGF
jgi:hypothetical protein